MTTPRVRWAVGHSISRDTPRLVRVATLGECRAEVAETAVSGWYARVWRADERDTDYPRVRTWHTSEASAKRSARGALLLAATPRGEREA